MSTKIKVVCNKCGAINIVTNNKENIVCCNCKSTINLSTSKIKNTDNSIEREMYELENAVISHSDYSEQLDKFNNNDNSNALIRYLINKKNKNNDFSFINDNSDHLDLILNDIIRDENYDIDEKKDIFNNLNIANKNYYLEIIDIDSVSKEKIEDLLQKTQKLHINIVKGVPKISNDLSLYKLIIGIAMVLFVFLFGLIFEKPIGQPLMIILSVFPSIFIGINAARLIKTNRLATIIIGFVFALVTFLITSYFQALRFDQYMTINEYFDNLYHCFSNFVEALSEKLDVNGLIETENSFCGGGK